MKLLKTLLPAALLAAMIYGCEKTDSTAKDFLDGELEVTMPEYVGPGFSKSFDVQSMMTASRADGGPLGYYFKNPFTEKSDTVVSQAGEILIPVYTVTVSDTLGPVTLVFGAASNDKYYGTTAECEMTVVKSGLDGNGSITNFSFYDGDQLYTDSRDGELRNYWYTRCGDTYWMRTNMAWQGAGFSYVGCAVMDDVFGRYYSWEDAQNACPEGWRLPSDEDWLELAEEFGAGGAPDSDLRGLAGALMADLYFNGTKMWEYWPGVKVTDASHLSVMPAGYALISDDDFSFNEVYSYAAFWTSEDVDKDGDGYKDKGVYRYIYEDKDIVYHGYADKNDFLASVRCVKSAD